MILSKEQLKELKPETKLDLLDILYTIEDELSYNCEEVTKTIDYLQNEKF